MSLLAALKTETTPQHLALENGLDLFKRASTEEGYRELIEGFYGLYEPLEKELAERADWAALNWDFEGRQKTGWLEDDLHAIGLSETDILMLPLAADLPALDSLGAVVGCLYVLEGSTLGGQVISRRLRESLDITPENGGRFFTGYAEQTGLHWRRFMEWGETLATQDPALQTEAVASAKSTFDCFARWFQC